jgi:hypothetical protein
MVRRLITTALAVLAVGSGTASAQGPPQPDPPNRVAALTNTPGLVTMGPAQRITAAQALAASKSYGRSEGNPGSGDPCWTVTITAHWGAFWPFRQFVAAHDYWCTPLLGGPLSYRSTNVTLFSDGYCSYDSPYSYRNWGGMGYTTVGYTAGGSFSCPTSIPWITYHYNRWHEDELTSWGGAWIVAMS